MSGSLAGMRRVARHMIMPYVLWEFCRTVAHGWGRAPSRIDYVPLTPQLTFLITNMRQPSFVSTCDQEIRMETRFPDRIGSSDAVNAGFPSSKNTPRILTSLNQTPGSPPLRFTHPRGLFTMPRSPLIWNMLNK